MNLMGAMLVSLWAAGWAVAAVRAALMVRAANPARLCQTGIHRKSGIAGR